MNLSFGSLPPAVGTGSQATATLTINDTTPAPQTTTNNGGGGNTPNNRVPTGNTGGGGGTFYSPPANKAPEFSEGARTSARDPRKDTGGDQHR